MFVCELTILYGDRSLSKVHKMCDELSMVVLSRYGLEDSLSTSLTTVFYSLRDCTDFVSLSLFFFLKKAHSPEVPAVGNVSSREASSKQP